jgi:uncharacterized integral membrane protein (TIGR00698 family)
MPTLLIGFAACCALAALAFALPGNSPLILAAILGMAWRALAGRPEGWRPGIAFAARRCIRLGVVLLGLRIGAPQVEALGLSGFAIAALSLAATLAFTIWAGRLLQVEAGLARLIGAGTAICGASAVMASNSVVRAGDEDAAYAVACVTVFGTLSMLLFPALSALLPLAPAAYGTWVGASVHEVAQVTAAAFQAGAQAGEAGTVTKLVRVALLAPVVLGLARLHGGAGSAQAQFPWFLLGFGAMIAANSLGLVPESAAHAGIAASGPLLAVGLAALGLETHAGGLLARGWRPLALAALAWAFVSVVSLGLVEMLM